MNIKNIVVGFLLLLAFSVNAARVDTLFIKSASMNIEVKTVVVVPDVAIQQKFQSCPVVYLLHGYMGDATSWIGIQPNLPQMADEKGIIFVCPDGKNSWYWDSPVKLDSRYESFVAKELVQFIDKTYHTKTDRKYRAITGLSMGGHGAFYLAFRHLDLFGSAGSMSGALDMSDYETDFDIAKLLGTYDKEKWLNYSAKKQIENIKNGDINLIFDCGTTDFLFQKNIETHELLLKRGIDHDFIVRPGAHTAEYWNNAIDYQILFFSKIFLK